MLTMFSMQIHKKMHAREKYPYFLFFYYLSRIA